MTRAEHLAWAKARALAELSVGGDRGTSAAISSLIQDFQLHSELKEHDGPMFGFQQLVAGFIITPEQAKTFIEGLN